MGECRLCGSCEEVCPSVFRYNPAGYYEVLDREEYPEDCVNEAMADCPENCIRWTRQEESK